MPGIQLALLLMLAAEVWDVEQQELHPFLTPFAFAIKTSVPWAGLEVG
jgi:hypothetical protein